MDNSAEEPMATMSTTRATLFIIIHVRSVGLRIQVKILHPEFHLASFHFMAVTSIPRLRGTNLSDLGPSAHTNFCTSKEVPSGPS